MVYSVDRRPAGQSRPREGDIITELDGKAIQSGSQIRDFINSAAIGGKVQITYIDKNGKQKTVEITMTEMP